LVKDYPKTEYLQFPITGKGKIVQVWANAGHGKTWFCLEWACSIANGQDFLKWKYSDGKKIEPHPVLYVEGEMSVSELQERLLLIEERYGEITFNKNYFFIAPLREQPEQTFESLTSKAGRDNVENTAKRIFKETGKKPFIFLDNITALTVMQEKEGVDWVELVQWLNRLRAQDYGVIFLHHGTKAGDTSSGSNLKERSIDISMHLSIPEDEELLDLDDEKNTQIKVKFDKWREFNFTQHSKPFIAVLNRDNTKWSHEPLFSKKQREVKKFLDTGLKPQEIVKKTKISQATVYRIIKQLGQEIREEKKDEKSNF
jgi:RecA-family ATPase